VAKQMIYRGYVSLLVFGPKLNSLNCTHS
jgi:hypothetical protein